MITNAFDLSPDRAVVRTGLRRGFKHPKKEDEELLHSVNRLRVESFYKVKVEVVPSFLCPTLAADVPRELLPFG